MTPAERSTDRRWFALVAATGLASATVLLVSAGRSWASATTDTPARRTLEVSGSDVAPGGLALALVALAAWGAVLVLRGRARRLVALLGSTAAGAAAVVTAFRLDDSADVAARAMGEVTTGTATTLWPLVALVSAVVAALSLALAGVLAPRWPELGTRYEAPGRTAPPDDLWRALDEGRDPTV